MLRFRIAGAVLVLALTGTGLTACSNDRWCEQDATDTVVADRFCEQNTPGYEWESGSKKKKKKKKRSMGVLIQVDQSAR